MKTLRKKKKKLIYKYLVNINLSKSVKKEEKINIKKKFKENSKQHVLFNHDIRIATKKIIDLEKSCAKKNHDHLKIFLCV